ncbi:PPOX class F420-dependent oxidoreductase [Allostreptomyces psammosilenae]|uniref:PPOX class probable F420-dependent enzyme n=1 Tax=Allostreptomyces psammosilenae TaxID=1892865 RepID=A0A852ZXK4_9ACTN|nr:PPOX class F420-dependent oxidoreductase [Allostreptomyces psammosilenae]NYI05454.1 PPOX class probable F420-dependent enzyme [Allostreptomyces psammosilenae]
MDVERAVEFVRNNTRAVLTTRRSDGGLQQSPVLATVDEAGRVVVSSGEDRAKTRNLRRDPHMVLCVFTRRFFGDWVQLEGPAEVLSLPEAEEPLVDYYRRVAGEHEDWAEYRRAMREERRCLLRMTPRRAAGVIAAEGAQPA